MNRIVWYVDWQIIVDQIDWLGTGHYLSLGQLEVFSCVDNKIYLIYPPPPIRLCSVLKIPLPSPPPLIGDQLVVNPLYYPFILCSQWQITSPFRPENHMIPPKSSTLSPPLYYPFMLCWQWLTTPLLPPENHMIPSKSFTPLIPLYYPFILCWQWLITPPFHPENHMITTKSSTVLPQSILPLYTLLAMTFYPENHIISAKFSIPLPPRQLIMTGL